EPNGILTRIIVYSLRHDHTHALQGSLPLPLRRARDALLPHIAVPTASVSCLSPVHYRRRTARPVSYYALLKWWLLLSQHPGCPWDPTSFRTEQSLGTLAGGLGCSPLDDAACPAPSSCRGLVYGYSEFGFEG